MCNCESGGGRICCSQPALSSSLSNSWQKNLSQTTTVCLPNPHWYRIHFHITWFSFNSLPSVCEMTKKSRYILSVQKTLRDFKCLVPGKYNSDCTTHFHITAELLFSCVLVAVSRFTLPHVHESFCDLLWMDFSAPPISPVLQWSETGELLCANQWVSLLVQWPHRLLQLRFLQLLFWPCHNLFKPQNILPCCCWEHWKLGL